MWHVVRRRILIILPVLWGVSTCVFLLMYMLPGDPASTILAESGGRAEDIAALRNQLGLDDPLPVQYLRFLGNVLQGDLGESIFLRRPVVQILWENIPPTAALAATALLIALGVGLGLGTLAALNPRSWIDRLSMVLSVLGVSMPSFWLALLLIYGVSALNAWAGRLLLPVTGQGSLAHLLMPALVLGLSLAGSLARLTRAGLLEVLSQEYIVTAHAKGLSHRTVLLRHAFRNALIPVVTILGLQFGALLGGTVVVETVFSRLGLGRTIVDAIITKDLPVVQGAVLLTATLYTLINLAIDVAYAYIDPRIRYD